MERQLQWVFVANGEVHAQQVRAFLEAAGIATPVRGESLRHMAFLAIPGALGVLGNASVPPHLRSEVIERLDEALFERDLRLPA